MSGPARLAQRSRALACASVLTLLAVSAASAQSPVNLAPSDPEPYLRFGSSLSLSGTDLLVGAVGLDGQQFFPDVPGRAYVFHLTDSGWVEEAKLEVPGLIEFGAAVALVGDRAFVGAPAYVHASGNESGAVFVFGRTSSGWGTPTVLLPSDAPTTSNFGHDLAAESGRLLVAGATEAYVFEPTAGAWAQTAVLSPGFDTLNDVDLFQDRAVLGSGSQDASEPVLFEYDGTGWSAMSPLDSSGFFVPDYEQLVALDEDRVAVVPIAPFPCSFGEVHGYDRLPGEWRKSSLLYGGSQPMLVAAMDHGRLVVGGSNMLLVYRTLPSGGWVEEAVYTSNATPGSFLFAGADISGNLCALGTPFDSSVPDFPGSVTVFELPALSGLPQAIAVEYGGTQQLELQRGPHAAFSLYWIFGSASGTSPGLSVDGLPLPLNFDAYYLFLLTNPNTVVQPTIGILDGHGNAPIAVTLPPIDPGLLGLTLHHAALTFDLTGAPFVDFVSEAVPLRFAQHVDLAPEDFEAGAPGWDLPPPNPGDLASWRIVDGGTCGAVTRMAAYTSDAPACGGDLTAPIQNARASSAPFRLGQVGDYELRLDSRMTTGLDGRIRLFVEGTTGTTSFEVAWPYDFADTGVLESLSFHVPGIEAVIGDEAHFEFVLNGTPSGSRAGWWIDNVELVKVP